MRISGQLDTENYSWKVGIIQKLFVNIADSLWMFVMCMYRDNSAHNHWFPNAQTYNIDILQGTAYEEEACD